MENVTGGLLLALIGLLLSYITYKKINIFWNFINTKLLRNYLGDILTCLVLYIVSIILIITGVMVALSIIQ